MLSALQHALTDPASFFEREAADPGVRGPAIVVGVVAAIGLASSVPVFRAITGAVPEEARAFLLIGLAVGAVVGLLSPFVIWLVYAILFHLISVVFDGDGEFRDVFALIGWGFAPSALSSLVGGIVTFVLVSSGDLSDPAAAGEFARRAATGPLGLANRGFSLLMTLWSAWVWTHAVAAARDLSVREAAITVGVVVAAGVLLGLASTFLV